MGLLSNTALAPVKAKLQLWMGYGVLALLLAVAALAIYNHTEKLKLETTVSTMSGKLSAAETKITAVEQANADQAAAMATIRRITDASDAAIAGLARDINALQVRNTAAQRRLATLEKSNEEVRHYLDAAVPAELACLLDRTCPAGSSDGGAVRGADPGAAGGVR